MNGWLSVDLLVLTKMNLRRSWKDAAFITEIVTIRLVKEMISGPQSLGPASQRVY
jgi:hypothetical protein